MSQKLRAILIDDELHCLRTLKWELEQIPEIEIIGLAEGGKQGLQMIGENEVDLVFLDIEMPDLNGFEMLAELEDLDFSLIFTTAYNDFAIKAFEAQASAYLLKPVGGEKLRNAVDRVLKESESFSRKKLDELLKSFQVNLKERKKVALPVNEGMEFVHSDDIIYCKSESNYTYIYLADNRKLLVSKTLKNISSILEEYDFLRTHKSYLINPVHIHKYVKDDGGYIIMSNGDAVSISKQKKDSFLQLFSRL